jgi:hypothetical protein
MNLSVIAFLTYIAISVAFTVVVATFLFKSGHRFLVITFRGDESLALSVNRLLVVGFYLLNIGFVLLFSVVGGEVQTGLEFAKYVAWKTGFAMMFLGFNHIVNLLVLLGISKKARNELPPQIPS